MNLSTGLNVTVDLVVTRAAERELEDTDVENTDLVEGEQR